MANRMSTSSLVLGIELLGLLGTDRLPGFEGFSEQRVDRLGEGGPSLVDGDVEQADRVVREDVGGVAADRVAVVLPAHAPEPESGDLIAA